MAQQVAVVDRAEAEVLEPQVARRVDRVIELAGIDCDELGGPVADETLGVAEADRLAERCDSLTADLLVDVAGEEPGRESGVLRLLTDHLGRCLDREPVQLGRGGPVVEPADRPGRHP